MIVDFKAEIVDLDGKPLVENGAPLTLGGACVNALLAPLPEDAQADGDAKLALFRLARRVHQGSGALDEAEAATLRARLPRVYGQLVTGRALEMFDGAGEAEAEGE